MEEAPRKIKRSRASLTGGFVVGFAVVTLVWLITGDLGWQEPARRAVAAVVIGAVAGAWVRIADL